MWIVIGVVVLALVLLVAVTVPVVGRLSGLRRAVLRLQRQLEQTMLGLQRRAETMQERLAVIQAGRGED
jgi:hypothetical protein